MYDEKRLATGLIRCLSFLSVAWTVDCYYEKGPKPMASPKPTQVINGAFNLDLGTMHVCKDMGYCNTLCA